MASEAQKPSNDDQETATAKNSKPEDEQNSTSNSQEKTLKKPDKVLPCPRCNSLDTKFCYYNNYNVNQPRHFCKKCQRYWTAGGTMRNVPVGAGRRKNKSCASHYRRITVSNSALQTVRSYVPEQIHHPPLQPNCSTVLNFGSDTPLYESMASVLSLAEKTIGNSNQNECYQEEEKKVSFSCGVENGDDQSSGSTVTASSNSCTEGAGANLQDPGIWNGQGFPQIPCFNGSLWPYQWSPAPAFCTSSFPVSFYPTPYWGCTVPGNGSIPWISPLASTSPNCGSSAGSNSPTLGKHSREGNLLKHSNSEKRDDLKHTNQEKCLWIPKTLRIDDPEEAAKSSIWATIGIKNDKAGAFSGGGLFKAFQPKAVTKNHSVETSQVLLANPAALSRSLNFQERS